MSNRNPMQDDLNSLVEEIKRLTTSDQEEEAYSKAAALKMKFPDRHEPWAVSAFAHARNGKLREAIEDLSVTVALHPESAHSFYMRGQYHYRVGLYREGVNDFGETLRLSDRFQSDYYRMPSHFWRAECFLKLGAHREALDDCQHIPEGTSIWVTAMRNKNDLRQDAEEMRKREESAT